ncbi:MAG: hypothetical protein M3066_21070 [Actinomycetota bacterium]|jgi:hypothetical protein|nr:hypothetical protein [Actinomycetota bacterium]
MARSTASNNGSPEGRAALDAQLRRIGSNEQTVRDYDELVALGAQRRDSRKGASINGIEALHRSS